MKPFYSTIDVLLNDVSFKSIQNDCNSPWINSDTTTTPGTNCDYYDVFVVDYNFTSHTDSSFNLKVTRTTVNIIKIKN